MEPYVEHHRQADDLGAGLEVAEWTRIGHAGRVGEPSLSATQVPLTPPFTEGRPLPLITRTGHTELEQRMQQSHISLVLRTVSSCSWQG